MRFSRIAVLLIFFAAGGCVSADYVMKEYRGVEVKNFEIPEKDVYRIFDKPEVNKLMITPSIGRAGGAGFVSGLTFGGVAAEDNLGRKPEYEAATLAYLTSTGRNGCRLLDGYVVIRGQWEFKYDCTPLSSPDVAVPARPSPAKRGR